MDAPDEAKEIADIIERLAKQFPELPAAQVEAITLQVHAELDGRPIRNYVPVLVEGDARRRLRELTATQQPAQG